MSQCRIAKLDEAKHRVYGYASVVLKADGSLVQDAHGDMIDPAEMEEASVDFMLHARAAGEMHDGPAVGQVFESIFCTPEKYEAMGVPAAVAKTLPVGLWIGVQVAPETFAKAKAGDFTMFSIQGTAIREEVPA